MTAHDDNPLPIGIFDSGVGGLTVVKALQQRLPGEDLDYLGDTARLPYGTKSPTSITRYAVQAAGKLSERPLKLLVVACNTASAVALDTLREQLAPLPVIGVVEPGAAAAVSAAPGGQHLVLATEATVRFGAYRRAIASRDRTATVREHACELLVAIAEEGWTDGDIVTAAVTRYLDEACGDSYRPDSIILGCTHFPLLKDTIARASPACVVDSAGTTAAAVATLLDDRGLANARETGGRLRLMATDGARRFARVGGRFLGHALTAEDVQLVDL